MESLLNPTGHGGPTGGARACRPATDRHGQLHAVVNPRQVIGELVGAPAADRDQFRTLVRDAAPAPEPGVTTERLDAAEHAMVAMDHYFRRRAVVSAG